MTSRRVVISLYLFVRAGSFPKTGSYFSGSCFSAALEAGPAARARRLPELVQLAAVALEPALGLLGALAQAVDDAPEAVRVIHLLEVRDLVRGEVVEHERGGEDQPPGEAQAALGRARAPAARRIAHRQPPRRDAERRGVADHRFGEVAAGLPLQELPYPAGDMGRLAGDGDHRLAIGVEGRAR